MNVKKCLKNKLFNSIFGCFFALVSLFAPLMVSTPVFADPVDNTPMPTTEVTEPDDAQETEETVTEESKEPKTCSTQIPKVGWIVCSVTEAASTATDFLYDILEKLIVVKPITSEGDSPVYKVWQYCRDITNIVFIIYLLIIVYSQITGVGISNYGVKKALPKLIIAAILVNVSYIICQLGIEVSNILGESIRGLFSGVKEATMGAAVMEPVSVNQLLSIVVSGLGGAIGGIIIAAETGAIWMLIPAVLSAIVSVFASVVTMAFRQAIIILLVMVAPLAMVANIFPNTEQYFKKWKDYLIKMLIFFPVFSLMFGASDLAGWAIIIGSNGDALLVILGVMVQFVPLFFSWKLLKMSGTLPGLVGDKIRAIGAKPIAVNRAWADSHRELTRQKYLASKNAYTPSLKLTQFLSNRRIAREAEIAEHAEAVKNRGLAYNANQHYRKDGTISKDGEAAYELQARNLEYQRVILRDKNNFSKGLTDLKDLQGRKSYRNEAQRRRLEALDWKTVDAADSLKYEMARSEKIDYENARGFWNRTTDAMNSHLDEKAISELTPEELRRYRMHDTTAKDHARYNAILSIMEGNNLDAHFAMGDAAYSFNSQSQLIRSKFQKYFDLTAPTQDVVHRLEELTRSAESNKYIDEIVAGLGVLNMRGDTDLVRRGIISTLADRKVSLGTYTSQALANFLMFEVKDNDPFMRRFGKYINLQTASMYNDDDPGERRHNPAVDMVEYVTGEYDKYDENGNQVFRPDGTPDKVQVKDKARIGTLLEGTSFKGIERTAIANMIDGIRDASYDVDKDGKKTFNYEKFKKNQTAVWNAIMPNIIGDQLTFLSGSEQIKSLANGITGVKNHNIDWKGIFGKEIASQLTDEQKKDYIKYLNERVSGSFLKGHVPNQIGRTKTDMLAAVLDLFALTAAVNNGDSVDEIFSAKPKISDEDSKRLAKTYENDVDTALQNSFELDNLKGFLKMHHKGYQGDAKASLSKHLHADELYKKYFPNGDGEQKKKNNHHDNDDDEEEDGPAVSSSDGTQYSSGGTEYADLRIALDNVYNGCSDKSKNGVEEYWLNAREEILASGHTGFSAVVTQFDETYNSYSNVLDLHKALMDCIGGF